MIKLNIDGRDVTGLQGQTILEIALEHGFEIPTLCHDERVERYGSCGVCVVEAEGVPRLLRSCSTLAADNMIIRTDTERVKKSRKSGLELLLSNHTGDCKAPCTLECPAQTDCQGYIRLIADGKYQEALALIKDKIILPGSIGRICPHPCEEACRRELVEEPVSIAFLKQFVGDLNISAGGTTPQSATGKSVAVIGGGPGGLTAAYFLRLKGHAVNIYEAMPEMGGMLQYGVPEYRLPKRVLQEEISAVKNIGVEFKNNIRIGRDVTLESLREKYDAVIAAVGAWKSTPLGCKGEELAGVVPAIEFLRDNANLSGKCVAVVGGGNVAMDACRTAVRLGAERVYNIYRRTRAEMPANEIEIIEAEEEGVIFKNLTNPSEIIGETSVQAVRLQIMELGEPDKSGRRSPVAVEGEEEILEADLVIIAIGLKTDNAGLEELELTRWGTIAADEHNFSTSLDGVFAVGDATNNGADIAVAAIGEANRAADIIDKYLNGADLKYMEQYLVKDEKTAQDFEDRERLARAKMPHRQPDERKRDWLEVNLGFSEEDARKEAQRCLKCGCHAFNSQECKLIDYANKYEAEPEKYKGEVKRSKRESIQDYITHDADKCILCGLCVRICDKVADAGLLGFVNRGFETVVRPAFDMCDIECASCAKCAEACPTGALEKNVEVLI